MLMFSGVGGLIAFVISLAFLRRVHLEHSAFLVCGVVVVTMGALFPLIGMGAVLIAFVPMSVAMLYCRLRLSKRPDGIGMTDSQQRSPRFPTRVFRALATALVAVVVAYIARAAWPDDDFDLFSAARSGSVDDAREALNAGANPDYVGQNFWTPLELATNFSHVRIVHLLVESGATIDQFSGDRTPLMTSARNGDEELVRFFLDQGADRTLKNRHGETAHEFAKQEGHTGIAEMLVIESSASSKSRTPR